MAQEFIPIPENDIGALAEGRSVAKVRAIDDQGASVNLTPTQLQALAGFDYSLLTEQIVPGEFWIDTNGVKKQVYARTWRGTTPDTWSVYGAGQSYEFKYFVLPDSKSGYSAVWLEVGMIGAPVTGAVLNTIPLKNTNPIQLTYSDFLGGIVISTNETAGLTSQPYSITAKCIK